jgi:hypothetical protein
MTRSSLIGSFVFLALIRDWWSKYKDSDRGADGLLMLGRNPSMGTHQPPSAPRPIRDWWTWRRRNKQVRKLYRKQVRQGW